MDTQTRVGIGGCALTALFTFLTLIWPSMPLLISIPGFLLSFGIAVYGFWPWLSNFFDTLSPTAIIGTLHRVRHQFRAWFVPDWEHPSTAREEFGDASDVERINTAKAEINALLKQDNALSDTTQEKITVAQRTIDLGEYFLTEGLVAQLSVGDLIAKGMLEGQLQRERIIPIHQWRVLELDPDAATAKGHGLSYVGVVIGRPKKR